MQHENNCKSNEMTLAEAIAHAESHIDDSPCGQNHKQLADWLKELKEIKNGNIGRSPVVRKVLLNIHEVLEDYVAHKIEAVSLCLRIKNIINDALLPHLLEREVEAVKLVDGFATTMPALAMASSESPYGGVTGRPRVLKGYIRLPDGRRFYLGKIGVKFDGWGDGILTDVNMIIHASACEETEDDV